MTSIDVIIPSYRLQSRYLVPILQMDIPPDAQVRFTIIADNPKVEIPLEVDRLVDNQKVFLLRHPVNKGVCEARNAGIEHAISDWILFMDDDVVPAKDLLIKYTEAIKQHPDEVGFFGDTLFPKPINMFTRGLEASVILTFFTIGQKIKSVKWIPTPNVIVKHSAIGNTRFDTSFDKFGAGEEIDFFLNVYKTTGKELQALHNAPVYHDWWHNGRRDYARFYRWAGGFTILIDKFPEYSFYSLPNIVETFILGLLAMIPLSFYLHSAIPLISFLAGIIVGECAGEALNMVAHKGIAKSFYAIGSSMVRTSMDMGKMAAQIKLGKFFAHFCKRFDHFCNRKRIPNMRFWAAIKFAACIFFTALFWFLLTR